MTTNNHYRETSPLPLETFDQPPTWCKLDRKTNRPTGIDRSACLEIRVSQVRYYAGCKVMGRRGTWRKPKRVGVRPLPGERAARTHSGRVATGVWTIERRHVQMIADGLQPRRLRGDWRSARAHAMRPLTHGGGRDGKGTAWQPPVGAKGKRRVRCRYTRTRQTLPVPDYALDGNPNKGATRQKPILPYGWSQPLRIEKWQFKGRPLPAYYLICPRGTPHDEAPEGEPPADPRLPGLSTIGRGHKKTGCPQRVLFLFLVLASPQELRDAAIVQDWLRSLPERAWTRQQELIARLTARYGVLFEPRTLVCRQCLGVRYGHHPDVARDGWRRRKRLREADAAAAARAVREVGAKARDPLDRLREIDDVAC